jgi:hypothetical protein
MTRAAEPRRKVPLKAQLEAALRQLGFEPHEVDLDHDPALGLRPIDPETGQHRPHQHDPKALIWRPKAEHRAKTTGRRGESDLSLTFNGDQSRIAKAGRLEEASEDFRRRLLAKELGQPRECRGTIKARPKQQKAKTPKRSWSELARLAQSGDQQP